MRLTINSILLIVAILLFVWSAFIAADYISYGTPAFLTNIGLASLAASFIEFRRI